MAEKQEPPGSTPEPSLRRKAQESLAPSSEGVAVASLVLGVLSCMTFWLFPVCAAFGAVSIFLGRLFLARLEKNKARASAKGWANAGIVLSIAGVVLSLATYAACVIVSQRWASEGKREYSKAIEELEKDPDFEKDVRELREELDKREAEEGDDSGAVERPTGASASSGARGSLSGTSSGGTSSGGTSSGGASSGGAKTAGPSQQAK